jgi:hypothetical protein
VTSTPVLAIPAPTAQVNTSSIGIRNNTRVVVNPANTDSGDEIDRDKTMIPNFNGEASQGGWEWLETIDDRFKFRNYTQDTKLSFIKLNCSGYNKGATSLVLRNIGPDRPASVTKWQIQSVQARVDWTSASISQCPGGGYTTYATRASDASYANDDLLKRRSTSSLELSWPITINLTKSPFLNAAKREILIGAPNVPSYYGYLSVNSMLSSSVLDSGLHSYW